MRILLIVIFIALLGGGFYWYSQLSAGSEEADVSTFEVSSTVDNTPPSSADTSTDVGITVDLDTAVPALKEFTMTNTGMVFSEKAMSVKKGDRVKITYTNGGGTHDFRVDGYNVGTKVLSKGQSETFEFVADKAGTFEFYCSVGNHRAMGMKGMLTVN